MENLGVLQRSRTAMLAVGSLAVARRSSPCSGCCHDGSASAWRRRSRRGGDGWGGSVDTDHQISYRVCERRFGHVATLDPRAEIACLPLTPAKS